MQYYLNLSNGIGKQLQRVIFMTHISNAPNGNGEEDPGGHWIMVEHDLRSAFIRIWDSLEGTSGIIPFGKAASQIKEQWVIANFLSVDSVMQVSFSNLLRFVRTFSLSLDRILSRTNCPNDSCRIPKPLWSRFGIARHLKFLWLLGQHILASDDHEHTHTHFQQVNLMDQTKS